MFCLFVLPVGSVHLEPYVTNTTIVIYLNGEREEPFHIILFYVPVEISPGTDHFLKCIGNLESELVCLAMSTRGCFSASTPTERRAPYMILRGSRKCVPSWIQQG